MESGVIVLMSDRPDRSRTLAEAVRSVADCRVVDTGESWDRLGKIEGVIADVTLSRPEAKRCLHRLRTRRNRSKLPLFYMTRGQSEVAVAEAKNYGVTLCLSAYSEPRHVVGAISKELWPDKSLADLVVRRASARAGALMDNLFRTASEYRTVDMTKVEESVEPVLNAIQEGGLAHWLDIVWAHDDLTFQHCLLVSGVAAAFAQHLKLSKADRQLVTRAALVHDVGKAKIPLEILNKPGKLDPDEQVIMRTHAEIGHEILSASGECDPITLAVTRHHHEMLDGSGYPDGLSAEEIADPVRLLTICDIYSALIEQRSYKPKMSSREAIGILEGMSGKLEGGLVQVFANAVKAMP